MIYTIHDLEIKDGWLMKDGVKLTDVFWTGRDKWGEETLQIPKEGKVKSAVIVTEVEGYYMREITRIEIGCCYGSSWECGAGGCTGPIPIPGQDLTPEPKSEKKFLQDISEDKTAYAKKIEV